MCFASHITWRFRVLLTIILNDRNVFQCCTYTVAGIIFLVEYKSDDMKDLDDFRSAQREYSVFCSRISCRMYRLGILAFRSSRDSGHQTNHWQLYWQAYTGECKSCFLGITKSTNLYQIHLFHVSFPGKQVPSLTSEPTYFRAPSGLFRRLFLSFLRISVRLLLFFF